MRKIFTPIITLSVVAAFTLSAVLCCCVMQMGHASSLKNMGKMVSGPCQKDPSSHKESDAHGYCFLNAPASDKVQVATVEIPTLNNTFHFSKAVVVFGDIHQVPSLVKTAYGGIPLPRAPSIPLYLQTHSLRL